MSGLRWLLRSSSVVALLCAAYTTSCCCLGLESDDELVLAQQPVPPIADVQVAARQVADATGTAPFAVTLDASASHDPDGTIVKYDWDFDNNGTIDLADGGASVPHDYDPAGTYTARVVVTDDDGLTDDATTQINVNPVLIPPVAVAQVTARQTSDATGIAPFAVTLDASESSDEDGTIVKYDWDFDNNGTIDLADGGVSVPHDYDPAGTYTARVVVTDNDGLTDDDTTIITVNPLLIPPVAAGTATQQGITTVADLDGDLSTDADGTVVKYEWDFDNDGTYDFESTDPSTVHDFGAFGDFTVGLRVTDNDDLTDETDIPLTLVQPDPPVAALTATPPAGTADPTLNVLWDASGSTDADGTIVTYDWDMDNDSVYEITNGGTTQNAAYTTTGIHTVGVRVTDNDGLQDTTTADCDVNLPPVAALVPTPPGGFQPLSVTWDASTSTDSDGTIVQFDWDMDNDSVFEITNGGPTQTPADYMFGTYTVGVRVTDDDGATDQTTATITVDGQPPDAALVGTFEGNGFVPNNVTWDASGSADSDGVIVTFDWDLDDNGSFEVLNGGPTQMVLYLISGTKNVTVRVTDNDGMTDQTTSSVTLSDFPT